MIPRMLNWQKIALAIACALAAACDNGHSPSTSTTPPAPASDTNATTVGGIDSDANGVRDDIDVLLARNFESSENDYAIALAHAKSLQSALLQPNDANARAHVNTIICASDQLLTMLRETTLATLDTPDRRKAYAKAFAGIEVKDQGC